MSKEVECRACLGPINDSGHYLFQPWFEPWAVRGALIASDLAHLADVEILENDKLPKVICTTCFKKLLDVCQFVTTVQRNDKILRLRIKNLPSDKINNVTGNIENVIEETITGDTESTSNVETITGDIPNTSWPQPIQIHMNTNLQLDNNIEVEVKQEVLSEDENGGAMEEGWEPTMDIKIEPEEIIAPVKPSLLTNGGDYEIDGQINDCKEHSDNVIKQEVRSEDELQEEVPDLPLDCMLCSKVFNSVSGLKAHVIANHSYGGVTRRADLVTSSPQKSRIEDKDTTCQTCNESFKTRTDLMVHKSCHSEHVCYVCDAKFATFLQLSRHGSRCRNKRARSKTAAKHRPPARPKQLSQPKKTSKNKETVCTTYVTQKPKSVNKMSLKSKTKYPVIEQVMIPDRVQESVTTDSESNQEMDVDLDKIEADKDVNQETKHEESKLKIIDKPPDHNISNENIEATSNKLNSGIVARVIDDTEDIILKKSIPNNKINNKCSLKQSKISIETVSSLSETNFNPFFDKVTDHDGIAYKKGVNEFNKSPSKGILNESTEERQKESFLVSPKTDLQNTSNEISTGDIHFDSLQIKSEQINKSNNLAFNECVNSKSLENKASEEMPEEFSFGTIENIYSLANTVTSGTQDQVGSSINTLNTNEGTSIEIQDPIEQEMSKIFIEIVEENSSNINQDIIPVIADVSKSNKDELNEMKVHLAINPLNKSLELFDSDVKITDIECVKSCESKLVSISEQGDEHS